MHFCFTVPLRSITKAVIQAEDAMIERLLHALLGAFMGAIIAIGALWFFDDINWIFVSISAAVCGVLAFVGGESVLDWLKELWWWT